MAYRTLANQVDQKISQATFLIIFIHISKVCLTGAKTV